MSLWLITPVYRRFELTAICLEQRARMIANADIEIHSVVIGDDENMDVARELGLDVIEHPNNYLGSKFNAGYLHALEHGADHCMAIGSDSWLHESAFFDLEMDTHFGYSLIGHSAFHPQGNERIDLRVKQAAGFGVGMVYPEFALRRYPEGPCYQFKRDGCDGSTWARCGRGRVQWHFHELPPYTFTNFHSDEDSVTPYSLVRGAYMRRAGKSTEDVFSVLRGVFDDDLVDRVEARAFRGRATS